MILVISYLALSHAASRGALAQDATMRTAPDNVYEASFARSITQMQEELAADPRGAATKIYKTRLFDIEYPNSWNPYHAYDISIAEIALACINGQPDSTDRVEYFMFVRARALLAGGRKNEALAASKSYFNICAAADKTKAIALMGECLVSAYPDDAGIARRLKLQLLGSDVGESFFSKVVIDPGIYNDNGLAKIRNRDWRSVGEANLRLLQDQPDQARKIFQKLESTGVEAVRLIADEGLSRSAMR